MNRTLILRLCLIGLSLILIKVGWEKVKGDDGMMLVYFIALGVIGGILTVIYILPWFGDAIGTLVFSSGEKVQAGGGAKAAAKIAQGDYEGAIAEHEKSLANDPAQTFPIAEMAKICTERLGDPARALQILLKHQSSRQWPPDDAAFLQFRMADVYQLHLKNPAMARSVLEQIIAEFPNTRHSANAQHKLHELERAEYQQMTEQRARATGKSA